MNIIIINNTVLPLPRLFKIKPKSSAQKSYLTVICKPSPKTEVNL